MTWKPNGRSKFYLKYISGPYESVWLVWCVHCTVCSIMYDTAVTRCWNFAYSKSAELRIFFVFFFLRLPLPLRGHRQPFEYAETRTWRISKASCAKKGADMEDFWHHAIHKRGSCFRSYSTIGLNFEFIFHRWEEKGLVCLHFCFPLYFTQCNLLFLN